MLYQRSESCDQAPTRFRFNPHPLLVRTCSRQDVVTLRGKVDAPDEASLPWGVQDVQKDEKEKSKTIHG